MKSASKQQPTELSSDVPPPLPTRTYSAKSVSILCDHVSHHLYGFRVLRWLPSSVVHCHKLHKSRA